MLRQGKDEKTTEAQYEEIMEGVYDARIASDRLDKTYFDKFKKILPCKRFIWCKGLKCVSTVSC